MTVGRGLVLPETGLTDGVFRMFAFAKSASLFGAMFGVTVTALTLESGHFHAGILVGASLAASAKFLVASGHHALFSRLEKKFS